MFYIMVLYIECTLKQYGHDLSKWYLNQACSVTELHITKGADYTDLFIALKNGSKSKIK